MPFGLKNAPHTYCRYVMTVFRPLLGKFVQTYMDDVIVYSRTFEEHLEHLDQVLASAIKGKLKINPLKASFGDTRVDFLGHEVSADGIAMMPSKIRQIEKLEPPKDVKGVRSFLGITGYYRRFIKDYAQLSSPLVKLTRKRESWS